MKFFSKSVREPALELPPQIAANPDAVVADLTAGEAAPDVAIAPDAPAFPVAPDAAVAPSAPSAPSASDVPAASAVDLEAAIPVEPAPDEAQVEADVAQLETATPQAPRALTAGAFLQGDLEIVEVLARGQINYYRADVDEWGAHDYQLVAERIAPAQPVESAPEAALFPSARRWVQDEREYAAWPLQSLTALGDWQPAANDETYLRSLETLASGLAALENAGLKPQLPRDTLWVDETGEVRCYGFFDALDADTPPPMSALEILSALSSRLAKSNLARGATLRLDDEWSSLPLADETKTFAAQLAAGEFGSIGEAANWLQIAPVHKSEIALLSDVGLEREVNEDCGLTMRLSRAGHDLNFEIEVVAVADGMGGHEGGEVASELTLTTLQNALLRLKLDWQDNAAVRQSVLEICESVNSAVVSMNENPPYAAMRAKPGATLVWALRLGNRVFIGNVGDSRAYRWSARGGLQRLTTDHSYVQDLIDSGRLKEEEAWGHPDGSVITSHIGMARGMQRDAFLHLARPGDRFFLVSDGVVDMLRDEAIAEIAAGHAEPQALCAALVEAANDAGGADNITVAALFCV